MKMGSSSRIVSLFVVFLLLGHQNVKALKKCHHWESSTASTAEVLKFTSHSASSAIGGCTNRGGVATAIQKSGASRTKVTACRAVLATNHLLLSGHDR
ncbi:hypothetical protein MLD38_009691 [Melastoma candidum]|uniref:Uncharacterized protein n=1 Tax=Melastoma candidum TaxID=119954 RepID=A0ACB9S6V9_9MYRT|nr:hypothetical protein MLD38_009691 [Melastoma candidum]